MLSWKINHENYHNKKKRHNLIIRLKNKVFCHNLWFSKPYIFTPIVLDFRYI